MYVSYDKVYENPPIPNSISTCNTGSITCQIGPLRFCTQASFVSRHLKLGSYRNGRIHNDNMTPCCKRNEPITPHEPVRV